jgi:hypothetical protein
MQQFFPIAGNLHRYDCPFSKWLRGTRPDEFFMIATMATGCIGLDKV